MEGKLTCPNCNIGHPKEKQLNYCTSCDYPFYGTKKEQSNHVANHILNKNTLNDNQNSLKRSQKILWIVGAFIAFNIMFSIYTQSTDFITILLNCMLSGAFFFSGFFIKRSPLFFTAFPLSLFILIWITNVIIDQSYLYKGILFKFFIIISLGYGINNTLKAEKIKKKKKVRFHEST